MGGRDRPPATEAGAVLRRLRQCRGLSLSRTAALAGVAKSALSTWETGEREATGPPLEAVLDTLEVDARERAWLLAAFAPGYAQEALARSSLGSPVPVGRLLKCVRMRAGWSQSRLAEATGMAQGTVSKWESGDLIPCSNTVRSVASALGAAPEEREALTHLGPPVLPETSLEERLEMAWETQPPLFEITALAMEAELWWRATRDPKWEPFLAEAIARRAYLYRLQGRYDEVGPAYRRSLRLSRTNRVKSTHVMVANAEARLRKGANGAAIAKELEEFSEGIGVAWAKSWLLTVAALAQAYADPDPVGIDLARRALDVAEQANIHDRENRLQEFAQVLCRVGHPEEAMRLLEGFESAGTERVRAMALISMGESLPGQMVERLHQRQREAIYFNDREFYETLLRANEVPGRTVPGIPELRTARHRHNQRRVRIL